MSIEKLIFTIVADDRPGVVQMVSDAILEHEGNWLESSLSQLCGQFAGIVQIAVDQNNRQALIDKLLKLSAKGVDITLRIETDHTNIDSNEVIELMVEANDRPGIVEEIASSLAEVKVNVQQMETYCESASMAGYSLFVAQLLVSLPAEFSAENLQTTLENVSDDVMVSILTD